MIGFSEAQIMAWITPIFWPFLRVLALFTAAPLFSIRGVPARAKVGLAFFIALCAQPMLAGQAWPALNSPHALGAVVQQLAVGMAIGFAVRLVFTSVEMAGEVMGLQMGMNFASFFDPATNNQVSAVARFFNYMTLFLFIVLNGHLLMIMGVIESFRAFPVDGLWLESIGRMQVFRLGSQVFSSALWIALPMMALLLFVNLCMGVISRIAPQMNIYAIGFPITLTVGLLGLVATLPMIEQPFLRLFQQTMDLFTG